jgi:hypothetical protein
MLFCLSFISRRSPRMLSQERIRRVRASEVFYAVSVSRGTHHLKLRNSNTLFVPCFPAAFVVSYVICQLPKSKLTGEFTVVELETLHAKTRAVSRAIQVKQHNEPSMTLLISTIACVIPFLIQTGRRVANMYPPSNSDHNTNLATGRYSLASVLLAEACRYAYLLGLHRANPRESSYLNTQQEFNHVEVEINRRTFWHIYVCDK